MELNSTDIISEAIYGNPEYSISVLEYINNKIKNNEIEIMVNKETVKYDHNNNKDRYLILLLNGKINTYNDDLTIKLNYINTNKFNVVMIRTSYTKKYWKESYKKIKTNYPNCTVYIITDKENNKFNDIEENITVIETDNINANIFNCYYYILKNNITGNNLIITDRFFMIDNFDENKINTSLFSFEHKWKIDQKKIFQLLSNLENSSFLLNYYNEFNWMGCFKGMSFINFNLLKNIDDKYDLKKLYEYITNNDNVMAFERIIGLLLYVETKNSKSLFGDIHENLEKNRNSWNFDYNNYKDVINKKKYYYLFN